MSDSRKIYVLDTNVLLHDPSSLGAFEDARIGIPAVVLEELDKFKTESSDRGRNSREVIRKLDQLRSQGSLVEGVELDNGGTLQVLMLESGDVPGPYFLQSEDNKILQLLSNLVSKKQDVLFISKDINARVKADTLGIPTEDYLKGRVSEYDLYKGWTQVEVDAAQLKRGHPEELTLLADSKQLVKNEFVLLISKNNPHNYKLFRYLGSGRFKDIKHPERIKE